MIRFLNWMLPAMTLSMSLLVGCQSSEKQEPASHEMASDAIQCDKCQVTWVRVPRPYSGKPGTVVEYRWVKRDPCPDCKDALGSFFSTGKFEHTCKACGGNMAACEGHKSSTTRPS